MKEISEEEYKLLLCESATLFEIWRNRFRKMISIPFRSRIKSRMRRELRNNNFTILCSNCNAGTILHDLGLPFLTPTINFFMMADDFIKFLENLNYYIDADVTKITDYDERLGYPICLLGGDIRCFLVHYKSVDDFRCAWNRRKSRMNFKKIFLIWSDRDGFSSDLMPRFEALPYPKVFFTRDIYIANKYSFAVYIPEFKQKRQVGILSMYSNKIGYKWYEKYFDFIKWLNEG